MSDIAIRVEGLGKSYRIAHAQKRTRYRTLQEDLLALPANLWAAARGRGNSQETFWALRDVSFDVKQGDVLGIIGRNGAGKSTLLKILSRITEPTTGRAEIYGRVGSLLEVGTGFHHELTGRENIFLSGAVLGMTRQEVRRKFDEIVAFADIEKFLDTPAKHYSSGMYMRLAFSVAAHLEPEILVVDEVLAVGDAEFQKKCLGKMGEVAREGRTVLFVSHNMAAVQQLCRRCLELRAGEVEYVGEVAAAISNYMRLNSELVSGSALASRRDRKGSQWLRFQKVTIYEDGDNEITTVLSGQDIKLRLHYTSQKEKTGVTVLVATNLTNDRGYLLANLNSLDVGCDRMDIYTCGYFECTWRKFNFRAGTYTCNVFISVNGEIVDWVDNAFVLMVEDGDYHGTGRLIERQQGEVLVEHTWSSSQMDAVKDQPHSACSD